MAEIQANAAGTSLAVAARHDMIMPSNVSVQVVNDDFGIDTLVLTMNSSMKQKIYDTV